MEPRTAAQRRDDEEEPEPVMAEVRAGAGAAGESSSVPGARAGGDAEAAGPGAASRPARPPEGRYGQSAGGSSWERDARTDRRLKVVGLVLGLFALAGIGWLGYGYLASQSVSGELITFKVVSRHAVEAHLEVRKGAGDEGVCTIRTLAEDSSEVGRKDVAVPVGKQRIDKVVQVRTTSRATSAELVGCHERQSTGGR